MTMDVQAPALRLSQADAHRGHRPGPGGGAGSPEVLDVWRSERPASGAWTDVRARRLCAGAGGYARGLRVVPRDLRPAALAPGADDL